MAVRKLDIEPHARTDRRRLPQRTAGKIAHEREAAREHAAMGERVEQLPAALDRCRALPQRGIHRALRPLAERGDALALPADSARKSCARG